MGCMLWNRSSILANRLDCKVDTYSIETLSQQPKDENNIWTSPNIFLPIENKPKVEPVFTVRIYGPSPLDYFYTLLCAIPVYVILQ